VENRSPNFHLLEFYQISTATKAILPEMNIFFMPLSTEGNARQPVARATPVAQPYADDAFSPIVVIIAGLAWACKARPQLQDFYARKRGMAASTQLLICGFM